MPDENKPAKTDLERAVDAERELHAARERVQSTKDEAKAKMKRMQNDMRGCIERARRLAKRLNAERQTPDGDRLLFVLAFLEGEVAAVPLPEME